MLRQFVRHARVPVALHTRTVAWGAAVVVGIALAATSAAAQDQAAILPLVNEGVVVGQAVQVEQALRAAVARHQNIVQPRDRTIAIVEGARTSGLTCDMRMTTCACELGALANVPNVFVGRVVPHEEYGIWVEVRLYDVATATETRVRRTAVTLDHPALDDALDALISGVVKDTEVVADLRSDAPGIPLDFALYGVSAGAAGLGLLSAVAAGSFLFLTYNLAGAPTDSIDEPAKSVAQVRLLGTTSVVAGGVAVILVGAALATAAAGGAVSANLFEQE